MTEYICAHAAAVDLTAAAFLCSENGMHGNRDARLPVKTAEEQRKWQPAGAVRRKSEKKMAV